MQPEPVQQPGSPLQLDRQLLHALAPPPEDGLLQLPATHVAPAVQLPQLPPQPLSPHDFPLQCGVQVGTASDAPR